MADVEPLHALHYDLSRVGGLQPVAAPPYDVIDAAQRAELLGRSPYNVVEVDLPQNGGGDIYEHAATVLARWHSEGIITRDEKPALWALAQQYTGPDGETRTRHGVFARVRVEDYGPGRIRPHERTHPGPKEDRLRLTRATRANLSPIFSLFDDPDNAAWGALEPHLGGEPWGEVTDEDGTVHRLWRIDDADAIETYRDVLRGTELLIADGHHRYETARVYQQEAPSADHVLMCLVALQDSGLTVFPRTGSPRTSTPTSATPSRTSSSATGPRTSATRSASASTRTARAGRSTSRTSRSRTGRWRASLSRTAGSTPPCSRH